METLTGSSSSLCNCVDKEFFTCRDGFLKRTESCGFPNKELVNNVSFFRIVARKNKVLKPVFSSSSDSIESQVSSGTKEDQLKASHRSNTVHVRFQLQKECTFGEHFYIVGDDPMFGLWEPENAIPLNWTDEHVWSVELDIPAEKKIQFKFILKGIIGEFMWQPGPDRTLQTWATQNTITIFEDWENAEYQIVTEDKPLANRDDELNTEPEILMHTQSEQGELVHEPLQSRPEEELVLESNVASQQTKPMPMAMAFVADNISYQEEDDTLLSSSHEKRIWSANESRVVSNVMRINGTDTIDKSKSSINLERNLVFHEEGPVLVPGLTPSPIEDVEDESGAPAPAPATAAVGVNEDEGLSFSELDEEQDPVGGKQQDGTINICRDANEVEQKHITGERRQSDPIDVESMFQNDIQWGRKTLQKLLTSIRLF